ncbi:TrkH family potassium uptake protein [Microbacterium stercoris]|uniref:TrkH family potassium uptake protein n=1 Tax=Microbacterium stercoris TaxID=2820289 RepID=A0A939QJ36_9MICO|nr:potassium transporter TrkG [Microbacterium stercoris]MBO3663050.1 TrkH family potassium uptake protein [Microbacterium stercoris]
MAPTASSVRLAAWKRFGRGLGSWFRELTTSSPSRFAILVYLSLIALFTLLLSLPLASADGRITPFVDAFFTAVSAVCVTGLTTVDMTTHWSFFGEFMIFIGTNIGGLGALTLASVLGLVVSRKLGLRAKLIAAGDTNPLRSHGGPINESQTVRLGEVGHLLKIVALSTVVIEAGLAVLLYPSIVIAGHSWVEGLWLAPLHAVMAFTNTGFTFTNGGLAPFQYDYWFLSVLMLGVFLGGIGFPVIVAVSKQLLTPRRWNLHAKLTLITTVILFVVGSGVFLALEYLNPGTFGTRDAWDTTFQAFFLSAMTRSGGFSVVDISNLNGSSLLVGTMLMFIGGGSASTAGGIKVTTLAVLALGVWSEARGRVSVEAFGRRIPSDVQRVAVAVLAWGATIVAVATVVIAQITQMPVDKVLFDVVSGFATVGLSSGVTEQMPDSAVYVMAVTIIMGRVGTVTLAAAVAASSSRQLYALPVERPIVG